MNLLLILLAMLTGVSGAQAAARGVPVSEVQQSQSTAAVLEQHVATRAIFGHRLLVAPLPRLASIAHALPPVFAVPALSIRSIVESALE